MIATTLVLSGVLFQVQALASDRRPCPYVLVTATGERLGTLDLPKHDGKPVKFRLCANATLSVYPSAEVDWVATEKANASGPAPAPASSVPKPTPRQSLSNIAKKTSLRDADEAVKQNQALSGKMRIGDREVLFDNSTPFFGKESVAQYIKLSAFLADTTGCPGTRARARGSVKNISQMKLRDLKALVLVPGARAGDFSGQVQAIEPSELKAGEEAEVSVSLSCDPAQKVASSDLPDDNVYVVLADVAGRTEEVAHPAKPR